MRAYALTLWWMTAVSPIFGVTAEDPAELRAEIDDESTAVDQDTMMKVDEALIRDGALEVIRVKIFPHERQFAPQFADAEKSRVEFVADSPCSVYEASATEAKPTSTFIMRTKFISLDAQQLRVPLWIRCTSPFSLMRAADLRSFHYDGELYVRTEVVDGQKQLLAVNAISLENYLRGVVPTEVSAGWPMESLKSQAVAARTYAVFHISYARKNFPQRAFDVDDTIVYQAYTGVDNIHERTDEAIAQTFGQIILYGSHVIQAYYHADSGGMTAPAAHAFRKNVPYCQPKQEPYALDLIKSEWQVTYSLGQLAAKLHTRGVLAAPSDLRDIVITDRNKSPEGRVKSLELKLADGTSRDISVHEFKRAVNLGSTQFDIRAQNTEIGINYDFVGRGSGHGVGMNQLGAKVLAESYSWNYEKILGFYYSGTEICSLQPSGVRSCLGGG